jgi:4-hydroxythreonine-4-phosphate dehydrogenase
MGDPAGIGPEVTLKALASRGIGRLANFFVIGDGSVVRGLEKRLGIRLGAELIDLSNVPRGAAERGVPAAECGRASVEYIDMALKLLRDNSYNALVTAPVNKMAIRASGVRNFEGHTEYLAKHTGVKDFAMMFVGRTLKVTLVTRHMPLKKVSYTISTESVSKAIILTHGYLRKYFGILNPAIGVAGLNPHAGESGSFGNEERKFIAPAIKKASASVKGVTGPFPSDVLFHKAYLGEFDAVIAMYHDQGLGPFKMIHFKDGVNMTLGLPFIRTSPDHGTAYDIARRFVADPTSMVQALLLAQRLSLAHGVCRRRSDAHQGTT